MNEKKRERNGIGPEKGITGKKKKEGEKGGEYQRACSITGTMEDEVIKRKMVEGKGGKKE